MKKYHLLFLIFSIFIFTMSCRSFQMSGIEVSKEVVTGDTIGNFDITVNVNKFLGNSGGTNLFNATSEATDPIIIDAVKREISNMGGSRAINVKVEYEASFVDILLNYVTFYIWAPSTARVTGTIVK
ncbi:MAG: Bor family protein [Treponema sp.]|nr:Bor family protein [Treponema sp.]